MGKAITVLAAVPIFGYIGLYVARMYLDTHRVLHLNVWQTSLMGMICGGLAGAALPITLMWAFTPGKASEECQLNGPPVDWSPLAKGAFAAGVYGAILVLLLLVAGQ